MSFLSKEPYTFINVKLTDTGRRLLSLGRLTFNKAALSDKEINYNIDNNGNYNISNNRVLAPKDDHPFFNNMDGSGFIDLDSSQISSVKQIVTASTQPAGFYTGSTNNFAIDPDKYLSRLTITYSGSGIPTGSTTIGYDSGSPSPNNLQSGQLIYIPWEPVQNSGHTYSSGTTISSGNPTVRLWYRIKSADTNNNILTLDRPVPDFGVNTNQTINAYTYPFNGVESYYGSAATKSVGVWNMNIIRTSSVIGTDTTQNIDDFTSYGSIEYNGIKTFLGFSSDTRQVGVVHFTNNNTGNTYAEQLMEKTFRLDMPNIMWHKTNSDVGKAKEYGLSLYDKAGETYFDNYANTSYRLLRDGLSTTNRSVGRVYHKLQIAVITDPELLTALTYKSNRNYTLPKPQLELVSSPKPPLTSSQAIGIANSGKTYFVTYLVDNDRPYQSGVTFGYPKPLHCNYISQIDGEVDSDGNPQYLSVTFPNNSFPYMRNSSDISSSQFSGTGWNANKVQIIVSEQDQDENLGIDEIPPDSWQLISSGKTGNGVYSGETGDLTINPVNLQSHQFVISKEDYNSGSTYVLDSAFYQNSNVNQSGLTFGNESFFFGKLSTNIKATSFKSSISMVANNDQLNNSQNFTYDSVEDQDTYITSIGIFNENNDLVAVGKPTFPIKKNNGRILGFKLEMDF